MKIIMAVLAAATVTAFVAAALHGPVAPAGFVSPSPWTVAALPFLIALMGWMPAPIEISVFQSLWLRARDREKGRQTTFAEARFDFNFGYGLAVVLAVFFVGLGALVMHGSGLTLQNSSGGFATQLIDVYQQVLGAWAGPVIAAAAFTTMFSTTLTVIDGYPRALAEGTHLVLPGLGKPSTLYAVMMGVVCLAALVLILSFAQSLTGLIDLVTTMAFLAAPVYGFLNYRLITSSHTPLAMQPGPAMRVLIWLGLAFFIGFGLFFAGFRFF
jgi:Mn2+/Fe2+ NRAMP family transporter